MLSNALIRVENLGKCYQIFAKPQDRLKQLLHGSIARVLGLPSPVYGREFWALQGVSFSLSRGETVGIVGKNGSGKSTLLQMICGVLNPSTGHVITSGRVAALLELGSGFNPDFTGLENIYLNASILGLSKGEIDERLPEIVSFADIGAYIDQPIRTYSSGMVARLAFSVAVQVDPDILIVDEALSVGDMAFQEKSFTRMKKIKEDGVSILFVSHSLSAVRNFCDRAIWIDDGKVKAIGERLTICDEYQQYVESQIESKPDDYKSRNMGLVHHNPTPLLEDEKTISIVSISLDRPSYRMGDPITIELKLRFSSANPPNFGVGFIVFDNKGNTVTIINSLRDDLVFTNSLEKVSLIISDNHFAPGIYSISIFVSDEQAMFAYDKAEVCIKFNIEVERSASGLAKVDGVLRCEHEWVF